jgi:hypothetical protein
MSLALCAWGIDMRKLILFALLASSTLAQGVPDKDAPDPRNFIGPGALQRFVACCAKKYAAANFTGDRVIDKSGKIYEAFYVVGYPEGYVTVPMCFLTEEGKDVHKIEVTKYGLTVSGRPGSKFHFTCGGYMKIPPEMKGELH